MSVTTKVWLTVLTLSLILLFLGQNIAGREGVLWAAVISLSINCYVYFYGDFNLLNSLNLKKVEGQDPWNLQQTASLYAKKAYIKPPNMYILPSDSCVAFSVGRNWDKASIIISEGVLKQLSREEIEAVIAYQIVCIKRHNTLLFNVVRHVTAPILMITHLMDYVFIGTKKNEEHSYNRLFTLIVSPVISVLLKVLIGVQNYMAIDADAAQMISSPAVMAKTLWKLQSYALTQPIKISASIAHFCMVNPLTQKGWHRYFQVQPSTEQRIFKLIGYYPI